MELDQQLRAPTRPKRYEVLRMRTRRPPGKTMPEQVPHAKSNLPRSPARANKYSVLRLRTARTPVQILPKQARTAKQCTARPTTRWSIRIANATATAPQHAAAYCSRATIQRHAAAPSNQSGTATNTVRTNWRPYGTPSTGTNAPNNDATSPFQRWKPASLATTASSTTTGPPRKREQTPETLPAAWLQQRSASPQRLPQLQGMRTLRKPQTPRP